MSILTLGDKKEGKEISNQRKKEEERKFPIKEKEKKRKGNSQSKSGMVKKKVNM